MAEMMVSSRVASRYLLGRQGLWPGRRYAGKQGVSDVIHLLESVQVDPMTVVARNHDLVLWNRVAGYDPAHLNELLYEDRQFFDYGGNLNIYPMAEFPYWQLHMQRRRLDNQQASFAEENKDLLTSVRAEIEARGPLGNRDFADSERVHSYRGRKATGLALYYLWLVGDLVTHSRNGFERQFDLRERVVPSKYGHQADEADSECFFAVKALRKVGLGTLRAWANTWSNFIHRRPGREEVRAGMEALLASGAAASLRVDGLKDSYYVPADGLPVLDDLKADHVPTAWRALDATTVSEVNFLSPLDNLLDRTRTEKLFGFEYLWEVYKPADKRRWGYYTMPILYGDYLVGRIDPKLDRKAGVLSINGFWLEDDATAGDPAFAQALARGLTRFAGFHNARLQTGDALPLGAVRDAVLLGSDEL